MFSNGIVANHILGALVAPERERLAAHLERVKMVLGTVIHEAGALQAHVYFPIDCVVSLLYVLENGDTAEVAIIGNDGVVGMPIITGGSRSPHRAIVQAGGSAWRMHARDLREEFERGGSAQQMLLRYSQALTIQIGQTAVCNRHHSLDQQLCRWLLMSIDRLAGNELSMTQDLIAHMLGVRREGVTQAAGKLQRTGAISYQRGRITVLDRTHLEALSCECYKVVKDEYSRLLPWDTTAEANAGGGGDDASLHEPEMVGCARAL
ncbi:MAG: Crp/Fnr family transcriptional regulator [Dokdonella sp.]